MTQSRVAPVEPRKDVKKPSKTVEKLRHPGGQGSPESTSKCNPRGPRGGTLGQLFDFIESYNNCPPRAWGEQLDPNAEHTPGLI